MIFPGDSLSCTSLNSRQFLGNTKVFTHTNLGNTKTSQRGVYGTFPEQVVSWIAQSNEFVNLGPRLAASWPAGLRLQLLAQVAACMPATLFRAASALCAPPNLSCVVVRTELAHSRRARRRAYFHPAMRFESLLTFAATKSAGRTAAMVTLVCPTRGNLRSPAHTSTCRLGRFFHRCTFVGLQGHLRQAQIPQAQSWSSSARLVDGASAEFAWDSGAR